MRKHPTASVPAIAFYETLRAMLVLIFLLWVRIRHLHPGRVPREGPVLLVANHQSYLDPPAIGCGAGYRHFDYIARVGLFKNPALAWLIRTLHAIPIRQGEPDTAAMREAISRVSSGGAVLIFPEGSRTPDGTLQPFNRGVSLLIKKTKCPVVPVAIDGAHDAWPRGGKPRLFPRKPMTINFGEPIAYDELMADGADAAITTLHDRVAELLEEIRAYREQA